MTDRAARLAAFAPFALLAAACAADPAAPDWDDVDEASLSVEEIAGGLRHPWDLAFLPDGDLLVTERPGALRLIEDGALRDAPITGVPEVYAEGQGGLLDVVLAPDFETSRLVYLSYAAGDAAANATAVFRARLEDGALVDGETIFMSDSRDTYNHFGGRMTFLPDGTLVLTLGDAFAYREQAQRRDNDLGTIVRMTADGDPAPDNPFVQEGGSTAYIWSYGHRNVQGVAWDGARRALFAHEHGPEGGDELNRIEPGANYGWPVVTGGVDYNGARITPYTDHAAHGFKAPLVEWTPSIAPGGLALYDADLFADWRGDLFVTALSGKAIHRVDLDEDGAVTGQQRLLSERGKRFRQIDQGPDGALYALTDGYEDGLVLRIAPAG